MMISDALGPNPRVVRTAEPGDTIGDVVDLLAEFGIGAVVVTGDGADIAGIISERDIVRHLAHEQEHMLRIKVEDLMTSNVITCAADDAVDDVARIMLNGRFRHMPVVDESGALVSMVSLGDLVEARLGAE